MIRKEKEVVNDEISDLILQPLITAVSYGSIPSTFDFDSNHGTIFNATSTCL